MKWKQTLPTIADINGNPDVFLWVRGWNFNREVIIRANAGVSSSVIDGARKFRPEVNFSMGNGYPSYIWASELDNYGGQHQLEWAGPVPRPPE